MSLRDGILDLFTAVRHSDNVRAEGWIIVCVDRERGGISVPFVLGSFATDRDAAEAAARLDAEDDKWGENGWTHIIAPMYPKEWV